MTPNCATEERGPDRRQVRFDAGMYRISRGATLVDRYIHRKIPVGALSEVANRKTLVPLRPRHPSFPVLCTTSSGQKNPLRDYFFCRRKAFWRRFRDDLRGKSADFSSICNLENICEIGIDDMAVRVA